MSRIKETIIGALVIIATVLLVNLLLNLSAPSMKSYIDGGVDYSQSAPQTWLDQLKKRRDTYYQTSKEDRCKYWRVDC